MSWWENKIKPVYKFWDHQYQALVRKLLRFRRSPNIHLTIIWPWLWDSAKKVAWWWVNKIQPLSQGPLNFTREMGDDPELDNASESRGKLWDSACRGNNHYSLHHPGAGIQWIMRNKNESFYLNCSRNQASSYVFVSDKKISYRRHHLYLHDSDQETHWQSWVMNKQLTEAGIKRLMIVFFSSIWKTLLWLWFY